MVNAESGSGKSYSPSRLACLVGAVAALPFAAHADNITYSGIQNITETAPFNPQPGGASASYILEFVSGDPASDFQFTAQYDPGENPNFASGADSVTPSGSNVYLAGATTAGSAPTVLTTGAIIDGNALYATGTGTLQSKFGFSGELGPWPSGGSSAFLGVTFTDLNAAAGTSPNGVYYGWVQLSASAVEGASFTINDWAYENTGNAILAGQGIPSDTPEPSSLMLFALGATGVVAARLRRQ